MATHGGIQSYMKRLWEVLNESTVPEKISCLSLNDRTDSLQSEGLPSPDRLRGFNKSKIAFILAQLLRKPSDTLVWVGHIHLSPVALIAKWMGLISEYVVVLHGIEAWQRSSWLIRLAMRHAKHNVATTRFTASLNARLNHIAIDKYLVIPLCADRTPATPSSNFKLHGDFPLLMVARMDAREKYKGMETVIEAIAVLQTQGVPAHFNIVGDGDDKLRMEKLVQAKKCGDRVTFWGRLNDADLQAAYQAAQLYVMPSKKEGFGIVFLEAMRHGTPSIGGNHGGTPEVIEHGISGFLVDFDDHKSLVENIKLLWNDPVLLQNMASKSLEVYKTKFDYAIFSSRWKELL